MTLTGAQRETAAEDVEAADAPAEVLEVDVLVVGAGISGIGAAHHLHERLPDLRFLVVDALEAHGGTWRTHRYPGVRSDSDLFTFGYRWKPWRGATLASGAEILRYLEEVVEADGLGDRIRYGHRVTGARWSSAERRWEVDVVRGEGGRLLVRTPFLWMCQGYYGHDAPHRPTWDGEEEFRGQVVHPQDWPADLDVTGRRVVVIGSGATAATLVPALAGSAAHVTMLQRSPTFFAVRPLETELARTLRALDVPEEWTHEILRRAFLAENHRITALAVESPEELRTVLLDAVRGLLPEGFDVERHFVPAYRPWQQRIAVVPEGDLFTAVREGRASVVTDRIARFTPTGIETVSGEHLDADVVVTATGFDLQVLGGIPFTVDGVAVDPAAEVTWRGVMVTGLPNLAQVFGYLRSSWTLRADLVSDLVCRVLERMRATGATAVVPALREGERDMPRLPWVAAEDFNAGYMTRSVHLMPKQGDHDPWRLHEHALEADLLPAADLEDGSLAWS